VTTITTSWNKYLALFKNKDKDIYFTEEYIKLYESQNDRAECFIYEEKEKIFLFPYLKRRIEIIEGEYYDFETAYGYGGPIINVNEKEFVKIAWRTFYESCVQNNIVCGFVRFHPLLKNYELIKSVLPSVNIFYDRKTIIMHLELSVEDIWKQELHSKHRNVIRKAESYGLKFKVDEQLEHLDEFINIYNSTMRYLDADNFYFFNKSYYNNLKKNLRDNCFLGLIYFNNKIISAAIFFKYGIYGHYHLSGSLREYLKYYPNNLLIYKTALYLKEKGTKLFHLGGGTDENPENNLYKFKKRFSKIEADFYIAKLIFNAGMYNLICQIWESKFPEKKEKYKKILLKYRY